MRMVIQAKDPDADEDAPTDNGKVFSSWERQQRNKPKKVLAEDEEEEEEDENAPKPINEDECFVRICDEKDNFL